MTKSVIAMVLVGGRGKRLGAITKHTAKPAVSFGGKYKLIDFVLSNLSHSDIDTIGIVTQYEPHELMQYIQRGSAWDLDNAEGGIHFLTPYTNYQGDFWQKGTAHAIFQHRRFINQYAPKHVLILSGDHVYKMNYQPFIEAHDQSGADITIATFKPDDDLSRYGIVTVDSTGRVKNFQEKPDQPQSDCASMGIYVFTTTTLLKILSEGIESEFDFGGDILPKALKENYHVRNYPFYGYFRDVGTIDSLYQANMDLLKDPPQLNLYDYHHWPIFTRSRDLPPMHHLNNHPVKNSLIADGTTVDGTIETSVIGSGVSIKSDAHIKRSLIFDNVIIGEGSVVENAIVLENTVILPYAKLIFNDLTIIDNETLWSMGGNIDA